MIVFKQLFIAYLLFNVFNYGSSETYEIRVLAECKRLIGAEFYDLECYGLMNFKEAFGNKSSREFDEKYGKDSSVRVQVQKNLLVDYFKKLLKQCEIDLSSNKLPGEYCKLRVKTMPEYNIKYLVKYLSEKKQISRGKSIWNIVHFCEEFMIHYLDLREFYEETEEDTGITREDIIKHIFEHIYLSWSFNLLTYDGVITSVPYSTKHGNRLDVNFFIMDFLLPYLKEFNDSVSNVSVDKYDSVLKYCNVYGKKIVKESNIIPEVEPYVESILD